MSRRETKATDQHTPHLAVTNRKPTEEDPACEAGAPVQNASLVASPPSEASLDVEAEPSLEAPPNMPLVELADPPQVTSALEQAASLGLMTPCPLPLGTVQAPTTAAVPTDAFAPGGTPNAAQALIQGATTQDADAFSQAQSTQRGEPSSVLVSNTTPQSDLALSPDLTTSPAEATEVADDNAMPVELDMALPFESADQSDVAPDILMDPSLDAAEAAPNGDPPATSTAITVEGLAEEPPARAPGAEQDLAAERVNRGDGNALGRARGMDGAKTSHSMGRSDEKRREGPEALQSLPGQGRALPSDASKTGADRPLPEGSNARIFDKPGQDRMPLPPGIANGHSPDGVTGLGAAGQPASSIHNPIRVQIIEALQLRVTQAVQELRVTQAESMSVVIRPDARTLLQLNLSLQDGQVAVEARMQRGDFREMNAQWGQLQQTLSLQGIRLNALENGEPSQPSPPPAWAHHFGPRDDTRQDRPEPDEQDAENNLHPTSAPKPGAAASPPPRGGARRDSWESWA